MAEYIEGKRAAIEALRSNVPIKRLFIADNLDQRDGLVRDILRKAKQRNIPLEKASRKKLDELSDRGSHQGVIAQTEPYAYVNVAHILEAAEHHFEQTGSALIIVCDHITDAGNLGAIARSAESVGASGLIIPNKRSAHVTATTYKSSAGAIAHIPVSQVANICSTLDRLKEAGFWVAGASEHAEELLWDANLKGRIALVLGNEQDGISRLVLESCDFLAKLPQVGEISSLNVAQASTAFMYEWLRQNRPTAGSGGCGAGAGSAS